ncbi:MAG: histidine kinase dimerization/phospho-acceptor domain-containing protein, partial [Kiloniellales bacterium]
MAIASTSGLPQSSGSDSPRLRKAFGLRTRFVVILLIALAPSAMLLAWQGSQRLQEVRLDAQDRVLQAARGTAKQQQVMLDTMETVMAVLGQAQSVRHFEPERCTGILARVKQSHRWMASLYVADAAGNVRCAHRELRESVNLWHDEVVQSALASGTIEVGEYQIGRVSGLPVMPIVLPIFDDDGSLLSFLVSGIELSAMSARLAQAGLPLGSVAIVLEDDGTVLSSTTDTEIGHDLTDQPFLNALSVQPEGVAEMPGLDDVPRFYGFARLDPGSAIVVVGIPRDVVLAPVRQWVYYWVTALVASVALGVPLAWLSAEWLVLRTARRIALAARALASGVEDARTGASKAPCELGELARQFDTMAERLSRRGNEMLRARDQALQANAAKSNFVAHLSHDLRTPLNAIIAFSQVIRDQHFGPAAQARYADYASDIVRSGEHLLSLIDQLLDLARIESEQLEFRPEPLYLAETFAHAAKLLQGEAEAARVTLEVTLSQPGLRLEADPIALKQILLNLLSNAVKYTPAGGSVRLSATAGKSDIRITVADSGIGMSAAEIKRAFMPFARNDDP